MQKAARHLCVWRSGRGEAAAMPPASFTHSPARRPPRPGSFPSPNLETPPVPIKVKHPGKSQNNKQTASLKIYNLIVDQNELRCSQTTRRCARGLPRSGGCSPCTPPPAPPADRGDSSTTTSVARTSARGGERSLSRGGRCERRQLQLCAVGGSLPGCAPLACRPCREQRRPLRCL